MKARLDSAVEPFPDGTPDVLEVTLRDGSYLVDFQFTDEDTALVGGALESVGFRWIEIGHGLGLNASACGHGVAAATDEEYLETASRTFERAAWGMFFIPGIGRTEDLRLARRHSMHFVRIGTNVTELAQAERFIGLAKELGFFVCYNAMKSYAVPPADFGRSAARARACGADMICLVDSAGGMQPDEVDEYLRAARTESDILLGFHGHDNLCLAVANSLQAIESGATLVDASLQGMGRSAGNAITEVLVAILKRRGLLPHIDLHRSMDIGQGLIRPLLGRRGVDPVALTGGYARFHSSYLPRVQEFAERFRVDPRDLIVRLCEEDQLTAPEELLERLGRELAAQKMPHLVTIPVGHAHHPRSVRGEGALSALLKEMKPRAMKAGKFSTLNVVIADTPQPEPTVSGNIQSTAAYMVGSVTVGTDDQLRRVLSVADGAVDLIFLDVDRKPLGPASPATLAQSELQKSSLLTYRDSRVWVEAVEDQAVRLLAEVVEDVAVIVAGDHPKSRSLLLRLAERGAQATLLLDPGEKPREAPLWVRALSLDPDGIRCVQTPAESPAAVGALAAARLVVVWPASRPWFGQEMARHVPAGAYLLDASIGGIRPDGIETARGRGAQIVRVNIWPALTGALAAAHESARVHRRALGWSKLAGVPVVSGGAMGERGDVIIDSIDDPTRVVGVADGRGGVEYEYDAEQTERVHLVSEAIRRRLFGAPDMVDEPDGGRSSRSSTRSTTS